MRRKRAGCQDFGSSIPPKGGRGRSRTGAGYGVHSSSPECIVTCAWIRPSTRCDWRSRILFLNVGIVAPFCQCEQRNIGAGEPDPTGAAAGMRSSKIKRIVAPFAYEGRKSHRNRLGAASAGFHIADQDGLGLEQQCTEATRPRGVTLQSAARTFSRASFPDASRKSSMKSQRAVPQRRGARLAARLPFPSGRRDIGCWYCARA